MEARAGRGATSPRSPLHLARAALHSERREPPISRPSRPQLAAISQGSAIAPLARPEATYLRRAAFLQKNLWVTPYRPAERFPGGDFPSQNPERDGLPKWTAADRLIDGVDLVLWHVFGVTHTVREARPHRPCEPACDLGAISRTAIHATSPVSTCMQLPAPCDLATISPRPPQVRTEDYPIMPCEHVGFTLKPCGFFDAAPCTDVPCLACAEPPKSRL